MGRSDWRAARRALARLLPRLFPPLVRPPLPPMVLSLALSVGLLAWMGAAAAHPSADRLVRVVHFEPRADGLAAYVRLSLPLLPRSGDIGYNRLESGRLFHYLDTAAAQARLERVGRLLADGHRLSANGEAVTARVLAVRIHRRGRVPPFTTLAQARVAAHTDAGAASGAAPELTETRHVLVDAELLYPVAAGAAGYPPLSFSSLADADPGGLADIANVLFFHEGGAVRTHTAAGPLASPVPLNPSLLGAARMFLLAGCEHILQGWDHLLFVLCLVLGPLRLKPIAWRITAFSVGHSLSLGAGLFGWMPSGGWFQPWVEVAIALSLLGAALAALHRGRGAGLPSVAAVGLVHGYGLAFGLRELLADSSAPPLATLLFFNLGVEAGQLLVAGLAWLALRAMQAWRAEWAPRLQSCVALACATVSLFWLAERIVAAL
ncbi:HupE/UreJ family protein [Pseudoduganella namucuonensis]|uniref:HupE / UreJ protein n=1 Tax=Pseudoduganella namucuonensis TaxID=1035707 RepID=A0A1I7LWY3_9BURK|nr:HupE/UreJ family protein [Pseudoduganella namucuonensis]SFV14236.1 HupE / UreJ protein [Pseudoduganella namucuonensis]